MNPKLFIASFFALTLVTGFSQTVDNEHWTRQMIRSNDVVFLDDRKANDPGNLAAAEAAFKAGQISQRALTVLYERVTNTTPQDFYGRVIDQYGKPVAGVPFEATVKVKEFLGDHAKVQRQSTQSDAAGRFQFTGMHGIKLILNATMDGYSANQVGLAVREKKTSPDDRADVLIWKFKEKLPPLPYKRACVLMDDLQCDGTPLKEHVVFSGVADVAGMNHDDMQFTLMRSPLRLQPGETNWDWTLKIEAPNDGLVAQNDPYPYWATNSGYQPVYEASMKASDAGWHGYVTQSFYFKNWQGLYGTMAVQLHTGTTPAKLRVVLLINPDGTQNLQPFASEY